MFEKGQLQQIQGGEEDPEAFDYYDEEEEVDI